MAIISTSSPAAMDAPFPDHQAWGSPRQWPENVPSSAIQEVAIMVATDRVRALFADARDLQADALEMLEQAFSATLRRRPGAPPRGRLTPWPWPGPEREPERSSESSTGLRMLESLDPEVRRARLMRRYYTRQGHLQGDCFYAGCSTSTTFAGWRRLFLPVHPLFLTTLLGHSGAVAGHVEFKDDRVVDHPVDGRRRGHWVGKDALPLREDQI